MTRQTIDFGIDLGTTNSAIALFREEGVHIFKDGSTETMPSVVRIDKHGHTYVGATAYDKLHHDPENTHGEFKRLMGTQQRLRFELANVEKLPEELSAEVIKALCALPAERGQATDAAVITIPAMFEVPARAATKKAAELAGLSYVELVQEPIAAAYAYGFRKGLDGFLFVYDLGGGTFDASILKAEDGRLRVVDHDGDNHLGGKNFDWLIVEEVFQPALQAAYALPVLTRKNPDYRKLFAKLKAIAERCKIDLSRMETVSVFEEDLAADADGKSVQLDLVLSRQEYHALIAPLIAKTIGTCLDLLAKNNLKPADIEKLLLVGGPTRTKLLRDEIRGLGIEVDLDVDPMTVVARGAAIFARAQRRPDNLAEVKREAGKVYAKLEYAPMSETQETLIGGRFEVEGGAALPEGCTVEVTHADGHWESGRIPVRETQTFICTVHLNERQGNEFRIRLRDAKDRPIEVSPDTITVTHGISTDEAPLASTIRIGLATGRTEVVLAKGTGLPATSREIRLRTVRPIRPGGEDHIEIPILEGEEERADRNRGGGKLVVRTDRIRRELPAGSVLDFTMTVDASGVPEKVSVYADRLDQWFEDFERATTEFASHEDLEKQLDYERQRLEHLQQQAREAGERGVEDKARALAHGRAIREIARGLDALAGGDQDAAGVIRNELIDLGKQVDGIEDEIAWPNAMRAYEAERADCRRVVHAHGKRMHEDQLAAVENEAEDCIRRRDKTGLEQRTQALLALEMSLLQEQPGFWRARFQWLSEQRGRFTDEHRASVLIQEGQQAIGRGDEYSLKSVCVGLATLLPADVRKQAPRGTIRSDVEQDL